MRIVQLRKRRGMAVVVVTCAVLAAAPMTAAQTIIVNPGESVQAAIAAAPSGATIVVNPGTYVENIDLLGKALTLCSAQGPDATRLAAPMAGGSVIRCVSGETDSTIISGFTIRGGSATDGAGILIVGASPRIESCTITGNTATDRGGGLANLGGSPSVRNCVFVSNVSGLGGGLHSTGPITLERCMFELNRADRGGGAHVEDGEHTLTACQFHGNGGKADFGFGAGLSLLRSDGAITECTFSANKQVTGGGIFGEDSSPVLTRCEFLGNSCEAGDGGGAAFIGGAPTLQECVFEHNVTNFGTGAALALHQTGALVSGCELRANRSVGLIGASGVSIDGGAPAVVLCRLVGGEGSALAVLDGTPLIAVCVVTANRALSGGGVRLAGGVPIIASTTIVGNLSNVATGGGVLISGGTPRLVGCTLVGNRAPMGGGVHHTGGTPTIAGSIIWANGSLDGGPAIESPGMEITYSCVQDGWPGDGNISLDPLLMADPDAGYRLLPGSPCIDAASNAAFPADSADLDGDGDVSEPLPLDVLRRARFIDDPATQEPVGIPPPVADMGAAEYQAADEHCPADWNRDGRVNSFDLSAYLSAWLAGQTDGIWMTDINADGRLDSKDISAFLMQWMSETGGC